MRKLLLRLLAAIVMSIAAMAAYLLLWPVGIEPVAWQAPAAPALENEYAANDRLASVERLAEGAGTGPEDVAVDAQGRIYAGYTDGKVRRFNADGGSGEIFADTGGRPLGLAFAPDGTLVIADADKGLLAAPEQHSLRLLTASANNVPFGFTDDVDIAADGSVYFSDASSKFGASEHKAAILEHGGHGRLLRYEPLADRTTVLLDGLQFANGVAIGPDERYVLVVETGAYRVLRYWIKGPQAGTHETFIDNLPGFPDSLSFNGDDTFWLALFAPRNAAIDYMADKPWLREVVARLPAALQPTPPHHGFVLGLNTQGEIVYNLQDASADAYAPITSVEQVGDMLYLGSLTAPAIGRIPAPQ